MSEKQDNRPEFDRKDFEYEPTAEEKKAERLNRLLSSVEMGWKISIIREQPTWCRGHLETFEVFDPSESVDVDYLIRTWGGQRLHLKVHDHRGQWVGGGSISLYSYPPKVQGEEITQKDVFGSAPMQQSYPVIPVQQTGQGQGMSQQIDITKLFQLAQSGKRSEVDLALKILERAPQMQVSQIPAQQYQNMGSVFEQMAAMMQVFGQMRELFGNSNQGGNNGGSGDDLTPVIGDVIKSLFQARDNMQPPAKGALVAPKTSMPIVGPPTAPKPADHKVPDLRPVEGLSAENLSAIADKLSGLSTNDGVDVLMQALGNMPESKRSEYMQAFLGELTGSSDLDGLLNSEDTYDQEDGFDDENDTSENHKTQDQGK